MTLFENGSLFDYNQTKTINTVQKSVTNPLRAGSHISFSKNLFTAKHDYNSF